MDVDDETDALEPTGPAEAVDGPGDHRPTVTIYWRPGCVFCALLMRRLHKLGVPSVDVDIWSDPDAAAFVRQHARGNETVPTVDIDGTVLVNPSADEVVATAAAAGIELPDPPARWWQRGPTGSPSPTTDAG